MMRRIRGARAYVAAHPMVWDALVALPLAFFVVVSLVEFNSGSPWNHVDERLANADLLREAAAVSYTALLTLPLLWRRTRPAEATAAVVLGHLVQLLSVHETLPGNIVAPVMLYAVARYEPRRRWARIYLVVALVGSVLAGLDWTLRGDLSSAGLDYFIWSVTSCALVASSSWGFGLLARQRELSVRHLRERAEALERERDQHTRLAAEEERTRIAREMHDVVAHSLSVIVVQADGAAYAVEHGDPASAADTAARSLATIGATARDALADTRRLVAVLRGGQDAPEYAPQAGVADLDRLVAPLRDAGRTVDVVVTGEPRPLPRDADLAAYRVVQESLTNVIKHAGDGASVRIDLVYGPDAVSVSVADDGAGTRSVDDGRGHGLVGMRERVAAYGGSLSAGPRLGGGFTVRASVPLAREDRSAQEPPQDVPARTPTTPTSELITTTKDAS